MASWRSMTKIAGYGSESGSTISQRYRSGSTSKCHGSGTLAQTMPINNFIGPFFELSGRNHGQLATTLAWKFSSSSSMRWPFLSSRAEEGGRVSAVPLSSPSPCMIRSMSARCSSCCCCLLVLTCMYQQRFINRIPLSVYQCWGDSDPHVFGSPGSGSIEVRVRGYGSFPFLVRVLSGPK